MNRILIIGYIPDINGISTSVMNVYRNLDRSRFQYDFLLYSAHRSMMSPDLKEIQSLGGRLYYMDYDKYVFPESSYLNLERLMLSIPDLQGVHVHDLYLMSYPLYLADRLGFPVKAIQCHASWGEKLPNNPGDTAEFAARRALISGDQFDRLACSELAGRFDFKNLPFEVIPNGVDTKRFSFHPVHRAILRTKLGIDEDTCVVGAVANLYLAKNPLFALKVFHRFHSIRPNSKYFILGSGQMAGEIREYVRENGLSDCVHMFGAQYEIDLFYDAMDVILHPSLSEGLPNSLIEAQAKGLPCLISDTISDMVKITPLVRSFPLSRDAGAWAAELDRLTKGKRARRQWENEIRAAGYDARDVADKIMALYSDRIQSHKKCFSISGTR